MISCSTTRRAGLRPLAITTLACLAGCGMFGGGGDKPKGPVVTGDAISTETVAVGNGYGLNLPKTLDGFIRTDTDDRVAHDDVVAGYARTIEPAPIVATVRVHKVSVSSGLDILSSTPSAATGNNSRIALDASIAQIRHFYPDAAVASTSNAYIVRFGAMQSGRDAIVSYTDTMDGVRQPITLRVVTFCCADGKWDYEFRFRYPASLAGVHEPIRKFLDDLAWSPEPSGSIDKPE
jgi:hypothetical protein